jgi:hypothetical protein
MKIDITSLPTFYINLDSRKDRRYHMESLLKKYGFTNYKRFPALEAGRRVGCSMSHAALLKHIVDNDIYPSLVLEDDLSVYKRFRKEIECPDNVDTMYLGLSRYGYNKDKNDPYPRSLKISELGDEYHRMHNMLARHAIIHFNKDYDNESIELMNQFINDPAACVAGDVTLSSLHPKYKVYAQNIPLFYQTGPGVNWLTNVSINNCNYLEMDKL